MATPRTVTELLEESLERVWNERDGAERLVALKDLYHSEAILYEPTNIVVGIEEISKTVEKTLGDLPDGFRFRVNGSPSGHHGVGVARWEGGPDGSVIVTGSDVARVSDGFITELHVFLDTPNKPAD